VLDTVVGRVLDQVGLPNTLMPRWGENVEARGAKT
jgi:3-polyprenyl-4-hydroxybenzoate decarboxylase